MKYESPIDWIVGNDTGASSKTLWAVFMGANGCAASIPYDPSDFGRCFRLLQAFPEWRGRLPEVAKKYPIWGPMVQAWEELESLYLREWKTGKCPRLYERIRELVDEGRLADGWERTGPNSWNLKGGRA